MKHTGMVTPTEALKEDHRVIERLCRVLGHAAQRLDQGQAVSPSVFREALDFIRNFADRCHHGKEEDCLFPALEQHGIPRHGGPVGVMLGEHEEGRAFVRGMAEALDKYEKGDKSAAPALARNARGYASLLTNHIPKEDNILYPMGEGVLSPQAKAQLLERFEAVERERLGPGKHQEYINLVGKLEKELGL